MKWIEAEEIMEIIGRIGPVVLSSVPSKRGLTAASLRRAVGLMIADDNMIHIGTFAIAFRVCLDLARAAGASLTSMGRIRIAALQEVPQSLGATITTLAMVRLTLAQEGRIVAAMTFNSRDDVEAVASTMNEAFGAAAEVAADDLDAGTYMAIITLHADVTKHLADRGRLLPRVINYSYPTTMPSLTMAQRAYADPSRADELRLENRVVHPAFMPMAGKMLAV